MITPINNQLGNYLMYKLRNYVNGSFVDPSNGKFFDNIEPATGQAYSLIPDSNATDADLAVEAARIAGEPGSPWSKMSHTERADILDAIADGILKRFDELVEFESKDAGKPLHLSRSVDIPRAVSNFRFFAGAIRHDSTDCHTMADAVNMSLRSPVGVSVLITPWNLPLYLATWKIAPALAMGNTVVLKPSEITPMSAHILAEIIHESKLPKGVFNVVHGYGASIGQALVSHKDVALVSFTGGTVTGRIVAATAAPQFKKLSLELGGKNSTIVFADCDFEDTVKGAVRSGFLNGGQVCLAGSRLFIERSIYDKFLTAFVEAVKNLGVGDPKDASNYVGSLSSGLHQKKVLSMINDAVTKHGGKIECGGGIPTLSPPFDTGAFVSPTVISGLSPMSVTATEEIFGPVVTVHVFDTEDEVVKYANCTRYGLAGSIWTNNLKRAHKVAAKIKTGMIWVNCWLHRDLRVPFGGVKESGVGTEGGYHSLEFYSELKNVCVFLGRD